MHAAQVRSSLLEFASLAAFCLLELLPAMLPFGVGDTLLWESERAQRAIRTYESIVYNSYWDLSNLLPAIAAPFAAGVLLLRCVRARRRQRGSSKEGGNMRHSADSLLSGIAVAKTE